jgi:hypothetical protein
MLVASYSQGETNILVVFKQADAPPVQVRFWVDILAEYHALHLQPERQHHHVVLHSWLS